MLRKYKRPSRLTRIQQSFFALPTWVQIWMMFILGPVNLATLAFLKQPTGIPIAVLALSGMIFTVSIVIAAGEFSKLAAAGHVLPWTPLVLMLIFARPDGTAVYQVFLTALLAIDGISLAFDFNDLRIWLKSRA
ncbi:MAG: hypothetical protein F6K09_09130 [Merismopedia sp. SIO2A8]|nr:hypothetical protein [Merismopedia sp. SIO2A8]